MHTVWNNETAHVAQALSDGIRLIVDPTGRH